MLFFSDVLAAFAASALSRLRVCSAVVIELRTAAFLFAWSLLCMNTHRPFAL
ncbi:peptidase C1, partial [Xanthomonas oryzae pv. oryzae]